MPVDANPHADCLPIEISAGLIGPNTNEAACEKVGIKLPN
jgi:hypothetical protein